MSIFRPNCKMKPLLNRRTEIGMSDARDGGDDAVTVELDENASTGPKYDVAAPMAVRAGEAIATGSRSGSARTSSRNGARGSRGSTASDARGAESFLIATVTENRAREIGICAVDLVAPYELLLWSVIDSHSYTETLSLLQAYQPVEVLVVESAKPQRVNDAIAKKFSTSICRVVPIARKYFDQTKGAEDIKRILANCVDLNITRNYVVMAALSSMMRYVEFIQGVYIAEKTVKVVVNPSLDRLLMDQATVSSLELVMCARGDSTRQSLWGVINNTQTSAGNRLLRSTMLQPPCHLKTIQDRHELIGLLLNNPGWFFDLLEELPNFRDLDRLLGQLVMVPRVITPRVSRLAIGNIIAMKHVLESLPSLSRCLETIQISERAYPLLDSIRSSLRQVEFKTILGEIERVINERVTVSRSVAQKRIQECFAVRAGIDGMLDVARRTYLDTIEKIHGLVHKYNDSLDAPVKLNYTTRRGYHLLVPSNVKELPRIIIERVPGKRSIACTTKELNSLNARLSESLTAVYKLSNKVIQELLDKIRPHATTLYTLVESVALLDMVLSFTNLVALSPAEQQYVRPKICEEGNLVIKDGRHPLVEKVMKDQTFVANNTFFDLSSTYHIITGPNCAGKSTYMKTIALITILAHMGSYVPADDACIPLRDRILTRFGTSDDMEENASTFTVEMTETSFILETSTPRSLILIDELGRATSSDEGFGLAWSVSEELIARRSYCCFATHFHELNELAHLYSNVRCYHLSASAGLNCLRFRYKLMDGPFPLIEMYGIKTAKSCGLPLQVIEDAEKIYKQITNDSSREPITDQTADSSSGRRRLIHQLIALRFADLDNKAFRRQMQHLKNKFVVVRSNQGDK